MVNQPSFTSTRPVTATEIDYFDGVLRRVAEWCNESGISRSGAAKILHAARKEDACRRGLSNRAFAKVCDAGLRTVSCESDSSRHLINEEVAIHANATLALINTLLRTRKSVLTPHDIAEGLVADNSLNLDQPQIAELRRGIYALCETGEEIGLLRSNLVDGVKMYESIKSTYEYASPKLITQIMEQRLRCSEVLSHPIPDCCDSIVAEIEESRFKALLASVHQSNANRPVRKVLEKLENASVDALGGDRGADGHRSTMPNFGVVVCVGPFCGAEHAQFHSLEVLSRYDDLDRRLMVPTRACLDAETVEIFKAEYWSEIKEWHRTLMSDLKPAANAAKVHVQLSTVCGWYPNDAGKLMSSR